MTSSDRLTSSIPPSTKPSSSFIIIITGQVESGYFPSTPSLYIRSSYFCSTSNGWQRLSGEDALSTCCTVPTNGKFVVDLPLSATFRGTTPFRWPQIVFSCYGLDALGHDVCRGYGACLIPTVPGSHTREVSCFTPEASSTIQSLVGWITGRRPEFIEPGIVAQEEGREVTRVQTQGILKVKLNVMIRGTKQMGFDLISSTLQRVSDFPLPDFQIMQPVNTINKDLQQAQPHRPPTQQVLQTPANKMTQVLEDPESDNIPHVDKGVEQTEVEEIPASSTTTTQRPRRLPTLVKD